MSSGSDDNVVFREDEPLTPDASTRVEGQGAAILTTSVRTEGNTIRIRFSAPESAATTLVLETARSLNNWERGNTAQIARVAPDTFEATSSTGGDALRFYRVASRTAGER